MELQDRQSYFRQTATGLAGFGSGVLILLADYMLDSTIGAPVLCGIGAGVALTLGMMGWLFTLSLIK